MDARSIANSGTRHWLWLIGLAGVFFAALVWLRSQSSFLRAEARRAELEPIAAKLGLPLVDLLALVEQHAAPDVGEVAKRFATLRTEFGDSALAALAVAGHEDLARAALAAADDDHKRALAVIKRKQEGLAAVRFLAVRERMAQR